MKHTNTFFSRFIGIAIILVVFSIGLIWRPFRTVQSLAAYAQRVVATCSNQSYRPGCYDKEIPKLMSSISMEDAFAVTKIVQSMDPQYSFCHVLGHELSARETKKDPNKWKDVITRCPSGECSNGCIHGALQERFRTDILTDEQLNRYKSEFQNVCEPRGTWHPTGMEQASCYHAVGHLLMYVTGGNAAKGSKLCDELVANTPGRDFHQVCFDGVFMQIFQPLEPEDFALVAGKQPTKDTVRNFCDQFTGSKYAACMNESWPLFRDEIMKPDGFVAFCKRAGIENQEYCVNGILYVLVVQFQFNLPVIKNFCMGLPRELKGRCAANTASRLIETDWKFIDKAITWCKDAADYGADAACYDELVMYSRFLFQPKSKEFYELCRGLPNPWQTQCLHGEQ